MGRTAHWMGLAIKEDARSERSFYGVSADPVTYFKAGPDHHTNSQSPKTEKMTYDHRVIGLFGSSTKILSL